MLDHLPDEPSAPHRGYLLVCPHCGAPCPLGSGEHAACLQCQTGIALPPELIAQRDRRRQEAAGRRQADPLWQRALRVHPRWWRSPALIGGLGFLAPFLGAVLGYQFGYRTAHYGQAGFVWLITIGIIHFLSSALLESRRQERLRALLLARQAGPDSGGLPLCRVCAAPLSPVPGAHGPPRDCTCDHCGADNILGAGVPGELARAPRPDLFDAQAAFREVFGDEVSQRASRLYPLTIFLGFLVLAVLTFYAVEAPRGRLP